MAFRDLSIRSSLKLLSLIMLMMMIPWFIAYMTSFPFCAALMLLIWIPIVGIFLTAFSLALILGIIYGCLSSIFSDPYSHLKAFAYAHGLFTSTTSLSLLFTFTFTKRVDPIRFPKYFRFSIPLWLALPMYFSLYLAYTVLAYRSLSEIIIYHSRKPSKDVVKYWRLAAIFCLLTAIIIIVVTIHSLLNPDKPFIDYAILPIYAMSILATIAAILIILSLDELLFGGKLRKIRYPILAPLIAHTAWILTPIHEAMLPPPLGWVFFVFFGMFPLPGLITSFGQDHLLTYEVVNVYLTGVELRLNYPSIILFALGLWLFFEFTAFYKILTSTTIKTGVREGVEFVFNTIFSPFSLLFFSKTGIVRIRPRAYRNGVLTIDITNNGYKDITGFKAYLISVDWTPFDKPLMLELKGKGEVVKIPPGGRITLICEDWSCNRQVYADEVLTVKITYSIGEKTIERVYTIPIT
ncbi:MAG: hypothetical protein DRJ66_05985 [Thermoprotei archaeon]|nr:MAG: hypothetical protein DRJ66_05985 [Thermoprotei archaeon]RLF19789.1 MAG: hypothetical protein DRZ82_04605 [Thermoprotei archaeon]